MVKLIAGVSLFVAGTALVGCGEKETVGDSPAISKTVDASDPALAAKRADRDAMRPKDGASAPAGNGMIKGD